jgi:hypothetical protein
MATKEEVLRTLKILHPTPGTIEIRTKWASGNIWNGYTSSHQAIAEWADLCSGEPNIFVTLNDLVSKGDTPLAMSGAGTKNSDVLLVNWFVLDVDAQRANSHEPSTDAQRKTALAKVNEIAAWMETCGLPLPVVADSGNGYHMLPSVCLPNDGETRWLMRSLTKFMHEKFGTDPTFHGASQAIRLYGAPNPKGGRDTKIIKVPDPLQIMGKEKLKAVLEANGYSYDATEEVDEDEAEDVDAKMEEFLVSHCDLDAVRQEHEGGSKWVMSECPLCGYRKTGVAAVFRAADGKFGFHCFHEPTCGDIGWKEFRAQMEEEHGKFSFAIPPTFEGVTEWL